MDWHKNAIFYELRLRAFQDGDGDGIGDFAGLRQRLDYLQWLGVDVIWIMPFYPSHRSDDGYDIDDYHAIAPEYGDLDDFRGVIDAIHAKGMRVITDLVLNHTSDQHTWFRQARQSKDSPFRDHYVWSGDNHKYTSPDCGVISSGVESSNWELDPHTGEYFWHRFYRTQPDLNYDNPVVQRAMIDAVRHWLDLGIDGFRLDAVPFLFEEEVVQPDGATRVICANHPRTFEYLRRIRALIESDYDGDRVLLAETDMPAVDVLKYFHHPEYGDIMHANFNFPLMPRLFLGAAQSNRTAIVRAVDAMPLPPPGAVFANFLRNHDELSLHRADDAERAAMYAAYVTDPIIDQYGVGIRRRLAPLMKNDRAKIELMHSLLFTLPGVPTLYYGDEIGMGDDMTLTDRYPVRTAMQWDASMNGGFSTSPSPETPIIAQGEYGFPTVNIAAQRADPDSLIHSVRAMILGRKLMPALSDGALTWYDTGDDALLAFWRTGSPSDTLPSGRFLALHNLSDTPRIVTLPDGVRFVGALRDLGVVEGTIRLEAHGYRWLTAL